MALAGTLRDFSLADIFQLISFQRKTGILTLKNKDQTVTVSVINGAIVSADSLPKRLDDHLGQVLVKQGLITAEQLEKALQIQSETMQKMGYILTHSNFITTEALKEALQTQISQIIFRLFRWTAGDYEFAQAESVDYDKEYISPIQIENVLMEGMRMLDEWPIISKKIPQFGMVFHREIKPEDYVVEGSEDSFQWEDGAESGQRQRAEKIKLSANEHLVFQLVDGQRSVQAIVERCKLTEFETCRALYDLLSRNLISDVSAKKPSVRTVGGAAAAGVITHAQERPDYRPYALGLVAAVCAVALVLGVMRPLAMLHWFRPNMLDFGEASRTASYVEMQRIASKVRVYFLHTHHYPDDLSALLEAGLVRADEIGAGGRPKYKLVTSRGALMLVESSGGASPLFVEIDSASAPSTIPAHETDPIP